MLNQEPIPLIGGVGGAYFLAEPGELMVVVEKRDRNRSDKPTELRALLVGPDREVLDQAIIPDDGQETNSTMGPPQRVTLRTEVERRGVYALNVTVSNDNYGNMMRWGLLTNCSKYVIETARGHRDGSNEEPIVLANRDKATDVCFLPRSEAFTINVTHLPPEVKELQIYDSHGELVHALPVADGAVDFTVPADPNRGDEPYRLHFPVGYGDVTVEGLTKWNSDDKYPFACIWTTNIQSWFPFMENRHLLIPYRRTVYGEPGLRTSTTFRIYNNSDREREFELSMIRLKGESHAELSRKNITLGPKIIEDLPVEYRAPEEGETASFAMEVSPMDDSGFSTYSTLTVKSGQAPAEKPLAMPIVLKPYEHENEQFGYLPDYPVESEVYFDLENQPVVVTPEGFHRLVDGTWIVNGFEDSVTSDDPSLRGLPFRPSSNKVAFDRDGDIYIVGRIGRAAVLLHSPDEGRTFVAVAIPGKEDLPRSLDIEQFSGNNVPEGPPPVVRYARTARDDRFKWRNVCDADLFVPTKRNGQIQIGEAIPITNMSLGQSAHSGIPSSVVSKGSTIYVTWGEATDPELNVPGVPDRVAAYDRKTSRLEGSALIGYGPPANDCHNAPSITMDSEGFLHVVVGTHGRPFPYARSLKPNDIQSGWSDVVTTTENLKQTYVGLVCDRNDTLHLVCRIWDYGQPFESSYHGRLCYLRKVKGGEWEEPKPLIIPPMGEYSIYYHRLTIDRKGRLFVSYDYWSTYRFYRNDHFGRRRAMIMSPDGGDTWKLVSSSDFE